MTGADSTPPRVVVVGGGLAGMTAAYELAKRGFAVTLVEASGRLGGKAGADLVDGVREEHGNHFFPGWYVCTRRLLGELDLLGRLVDMTRFHELHLGRFPRCETLEGPTLLRNLPRNFLRGRFLPPAEAFLLVYAYLDLASRGDDDTLDATSLDAFLAARPYCLPGPRRWARTLILRAVATPGERLSALTYRAVVRFWLRRRVPMFSVLDGDLQEAFIEPFAARLAGLGCRVLLGRRVTGFATADGRVTAARLAGGEDGRLAGDLFVLATPAERTAALLGGGLAAAAGTLGGLAHLESVPMAALTVYLRRPIPELPADHVMLAGSRYGLSFLDVARHWRRAEAPAVLNFNVGDPSSLHGLPPAEMAERVVAELLAWVPAIRREDVLRCVMKPNLETPLLINTAGSWRHRPPPGPTGIANLFLAGDYCRSAANVVSMEGAIASGLAAATAVLARAGRHGEAARVTIPAPLEPPRWLLAALRRLLAPAARLAARRARRCPAPAVPGTSFIRD